MRRWSRDNEKKNYLCLAPSLHPQRELYYALHILCCWCWLTLIMFICNCQLKMNHFVGWLHISCIDIIHPTVVDKLPLHSFFFPLSSFTFYFQKRPLSFDGIIPATHVWKETHILSNQEKYLPLEAHININIWLFINSPQGSIVDFGIYYCEVVSHVVHFLHLANNDR